jgi:hypothetical protein
VDAGVLDARGREKKPQDASRFECDGAVRRIDLRPPRNSSLPNPAKHLHRPLAPQIRIERTQHRTHRGIFERQRHPRFAASWGGRPMQMRPAARARRSTRVGYRTPRPQRVLLASTTSEAPDDEVVVRIGPDFRERGQHSGAEVAVDPDRIHDGRWVHEAMVEPWPVNPHHQDQVTLLRPAAVASSRSSRARCTAEERSQACSLA